MSDPDDDYELEFSPLSGPFSDGGVTVQVMIYRGQGSTENWVLEAVVDDESSVVWDYLFTTDAEAYDAFVAQVRQQGLATVIDPPDDDVGGPAS